MPFAQRHRTAILTVVPIVFAMLIIGNAAIVVFVLASGGHSIWAGAIAALSVVALILTRRIAMSRQR